MIRQMTIQQGIDPRDFAIVAGGGQRIFHMVISGDDGRIVRAHPFSRHFRGFGLLLQPRAPLFPPFRKPGILKQGRFRQLFGSKVAEGVGEIRFGLLHPGK